MSAGPRLGDIVTRANNLAEMLGTFARYVMELERHPIQPGGLIIAAEFAEKLGSDLSTYADELP